MVRLVAGGPLVAGLCVLALGPPATLVPAPPPLFEEVPPARSGLLWRHDNAFSPRRLPAGEPGPGSSLRRLRQRRLDGHLPGEQRFLRLLSACQEAAGTRLYRNNRDGTFTDVTAGRESRAATPSAWGSRRATTTTTGTPTSSSPPTGDPRCTATMATGPSPTSPRQPAWRLAGWTTSAAWLDYDGDGLLDLFVCSFVQYTRESQELCLKSAAASPAIASRGCSSRPHPSSTGTTATGRSRTSAARHG